MEIMDNNNHLIITKDSPVGKTMSEINQEMKSIEIDISYIS